MGIRIAIPLAFFLLAPACHSGSAEDVGSGYMLPVCETVKTDGSMTWRVSSDAVGASRKKTECTSPVSQGLPIGAHLRIAAYKNGLADLEFACNMEQSKKFMIRNAGKRVAIVINKQVAGEAVIASHPTDFRCGILYLDSLQTAIDYCEKMSNPMKFDKSMCMQICDRSNTKLPACIAAPD